MHMNLEEALGLARYAVLLVLETSAPILVIGMVVGLVISLLQAVTQLQEQTLSFVPKMLAMAAAAVLFLPWMAEKIIGFSVNMFAMQTLGG